MLLHVLAQLPGARLRALHVDHGLHPESPVWERHCRASCQALGVDYASERVQVTDRAALGLEAAARRARYGCFARHLAPGEVLLTAHHRDDQAETLLLQLLRGTGLAGLAGMATKMPFSAGFHARPLLGVPRTYLEQYARQAGLRWLEDPSNRDQRLARNFIRHRVLPALATRWPTAGERLAQAARHAAEANTLLQELAEADTGPCRLADGALHVPALLALPLPRQRNVLRFWLREQGCPSPTTAQTELLLVQLNKTPDTRRGFFSLGKTRLARYRDRLARYVPAPAVSGVLPWDGNAPLLIPPGDRWLRLRRADSGGLAQSRVNGAAMEVRFRRGGETCRLPGRRHHHKLKKLLQQAGVPPWERAQLPLLYINDELAAIADRWVCTPYAAQPGEPGYVVTLETLTGGTAPHA